MKQKMIKLCATLLIAIGFTGVFAQQAITASGGNAAGSGGTVSYSVGQVAYTTNSGANGSVAQGVQQPFEIFVVTGIEEADGISLDISVYPNPASDFLKLKIEGYEADHLSFELYNINGSLLQNGKIVGRETVIHTEELSSATYLLQITDNQKRVQTFKIIKN